MLIRHNVSRFFSNFVPKHNELHPSDVHDFRQFLTYYENILVLTGAGVSTESGIPDYRSEGVGMFERTTYKPIQYSDFVKNPAARKRYWARNFVAWPRFSTFHPNKIHWFISSLQNREGKLSCLVTQNVDGLHSKAGSQNVLELHGNAFWVKCTSCGDVFSRFDFQAELQARNPSMEYSHSQIRPDGDVEIKEEDVKDFDVPDCKKCGGILKPTIVFFGENVPEVVVDKIENYVDKSDALLVLGTSLSTLSSYRIVEQAFDLCKFICLVNIGETRGDKLADLRISAKIGDLVSSMYEKPI